MDRFRPLLFQRDHNHGHRPPPKEDKKMAITIIQPKPIPRYSGHRHEAGASDSDSDSDSEAGGVDIEGDISMSKGGSSSNRPAKRARYGRSDIVTPGEVITDDPQWMRLVNPDSVSPQQSP